MGESPDTGAGSPDQDGVHDAPSEGLWASPDTFSASSDSASGQSPTPIADSAGAIPAWGASQGQFANDQAPPPGVWSDTTFPPPGQQQTRNARAQRGAITVAIAVVLVVLRFAVFHSASGNSTNQNSTNPSSISASIDALNICIETGQPIVTMFSDLSGTTDPGTQAATIQKAIDQEQQIATTLPDGTTKDALTKMIADMQTLQTDTAAANYTAEATDTSAVSSDNDDLSATCGISNP